MDWKRCVGNHSIGEALDLSHTVPLAIRRGVVPPWWSSNTLAQREGAWTTFCWTTSKFSAMLA